MEIFQKGIVSFFYLLAWTVSILASLFFLIFILGEGAIQDMLSGKAEELSTFIPWLLVAILGCVVSFFKKTIGGILMVLGGFAMIINFYMRTQWQEIGMMVAYGLPYIVAGFIFILLRKK